MSYPLAPIPVQKGEITIFSPLTYLIAAVKPVNTVGFIWNSVCVTASLQFVSPVSPYKSGLTMGTTLPSGNPGTKDVRKHRLHQPLELTPLESNSPCPSQLWPQLSSLLSDPRGADPSHVNSTAQAVIHTPSFLTPDPHNSLGRLAEQEQGYCSNPYFANGSTEAQGREGHVYTAHRRQG